MIKIGNLQVMFDHHFNKKQQRVVKSTVFSKDGKYITQGTATCSKKDNFCKDTGRRKSLAVAFARDKSLTKEERTAFWESYRTDMTKRPRWTKSNKQAAKTFLGNLKTISEETTLSS